MAKDPAFLFYPNDWNGGTMTMSRHLKGCYIDLLVAQFNSGPLSLEEIKTVLGTDFAIWGALTKKFKKTDTGLFFNERLEIEKSKRVEYSKSRSENRKKGKNSTYERTYENHMISHMENENENENINEFEGGVGETKNGVERKVKISILENLIAEWKRSDLHFSAVDNPDLIMIAEKISGVNDLSHLSEQQIDSIKTVFQNIIQFVKSGDNVNFYGSIKSINTHFDKIINSIKNGKNGNGKKQSAGDLAREAMAILKAKDNL